MNETPFYIEDGGARLFAVLHRPEQERARAAFVFCHPFAEEKLWAHRVFVSFARELAGRGHPVLRFDYRGYGDSEGEFADFRLEDHVADIDRARAWLRAELGEATPIGLLGLRLGASLACLAHRKVPVQGPLILWDPVLDGADFIQEFLRSHLSTQLAIWGEVRENRERLVERLMAGEKVNVEGYDVTRALYQSLSALSLGESVEALPADSLVVQIGRTRRPRSQPGAFAQQTGAALRLAVEEPFWREIKRFYYRADDLFDTTLSWLEEIA